MSEPYEGIITRLLPSDHRDANPRHVEAWIRLTHGCLDGLSRAEFKHEITIALGCIAAATPQDTEELARELT